MYLTEGDFNVNAERQSLVVPNTDGVRQSTLTPEGVIQEFLFEDVKTLIDVMQRGCKVSRNGPCVGKRDLNSEYKWLSYREVIERFQNFAHGLAQVGMRKGQESNVGIYAQNCVEWVVTEYACYSQNAVVVPLYDTLGPTACSYILNHVEAEFLICDTENKVKSILDIKENIPKLRHIICIHEVSENIKKIAVQKDVLLHLFKDIEQLGKKSTDSLEVPSPTDVSTICFTSGTTGDPKGAIMTHANLVTAACGVVKHFGDNFIGSGDRFLSYLPMAHMMERVCQVILYVSGGSVGFFGGNIKNLLEDIACLKPTLFPAVPRVLNRIYDKVQSQLQSNLLKKYLFNAALRAKKADFERGIIRNNSLWDHLVLKNIQNLFGGKVRVLLSGGAPIRSEILCFYKYALGCPVLQGYGMTECAAAISISVFQDTIGSHGPPLPCCFIKLGDVPDMGYYARNGEGEVLVKGPVVTSGYYKDPVSTAEVLDADGWLSTGDIGKWNKDGSLSLTDRKKNFMKLSQGEYISPEKVEAVYLGSPLVDQIFVHADPLKNCLVAIVVPDKESITSWCTGQNIQGDWNEICQNKDVKMHIFENLCRTGNKAGLNGFEKVKDIHLYPDGFTSENDFVTVTMKLKRSNLQKYFKDIIQKMYDNLR